MPSNRIRTKITCHNLAPFKDLDKEIKSNSLKMSVFSNNGNGKTFLSRVFRLTENHADNLIEENGKIKTDKLISFGATSSSFSFKITDKDNNVVENFTLNLNRGNIPTIPNTNYIYHTFNEDYVEENIQILSYEKNSNIEGFILGKANIDVSKEEKELKEKEEKEKSEIETVQIYIKKYLKKKVDSIQNIRRLNEYKDITYLNIFNKIDSPISSVKKSYVELVNDYNKIKSVPENLNDIYKIIEIGVESEYLNRLIEELANEYDLSILAEEFKNKIKSKKIFVENGLKFLGDGDTCPFCEQKLENEAITIINRYNEYLKDEEAKTIDKFVSYIERLNQLNKSIDKSNNDNNKKSNEFNSYKTKYIPSIQNEELTLLETETIKNTIEQVITLIEQKIKDISEPVIDENNVCIKIVSEINKINLKIEANNKKIEIINSKKNQINKENVSVRKSICNVVFNELIETHRTDIKSIINLSAEINILKKQIKTKREQQKASKRGKVLNTIRKVLNYFFSEKYTLDDETFRLIFDKNILEEGQAKDVLSAGEKNIIAFAYYIGDCHLKIESETDYEKLFFIIDDPISSMDFNHVYTLCGIIKDLKLIIENIIYEKFLIFTHNNDFMRVLASNNIVDKKLILKDNIISEFNNNLTVPYINHLIDIYEVCRKDRIPSHTTANSIRHIIETLVKFEKIDVNENSIKNYIKEQIPDESKTYTLINDLSHGGWRSEQVPITEEDFKDVCETIITHIEKKYEGQIEYCKNFN